MRMQTSTGSYLLEVGPCGVWFRLYFLSVFQPSNSAMTNVVHAPATSEPRTPKYVHERDTLSLSLLVLLLGLAPH